MTKEINKVVGGFKKETKEQLTKYKKERSMKELCSNGNKFDFSDIKV